MGIDFFGQKPLFYKINNGVLSFASTGKCLMYNKSLKDNLNRDSIISYLSYGFVGPDLCIFNNIEKVRPGQLVEVDLNSMNSKVFDNFQEQNYCLHEYSKYSEFHSTSQIHDLLTEVIRDHLASDFPVCSTLSSGVDSSIVTAYASKEMRKIRPENFRSYSITSSNEDDESAGAKKFADQLNVNLEYVNISEDKFKNYFNSIVANIDEPNSDSAIITSSAIFDVAKQTHKVILMGDGGDELFQGYKRHILHNVLSKLMGIWFFSKLVHPFLLITLKLVMLTGVRNQFLLILSNALKCANTPGNLIKSMLLIDDFGADLICSDDKNELKSPPHVDDQKFYLPGNNLYRVDRVSLLFGIESRAPLLDLRFLRISRSIDFSLSQNKNKKILKSIQKEIFSKIKIPKGKRGFNTSLKTFTDSKYAQNYIDIAINNLRDSYKIKFNQGMLSERRKYNLAVLGYWISNS
jgi:asparagine synthase (glutamine-hydrolysing)